MLAHVPALLKSISLSYSNQISVIYGQCALKEFTEKIKYCGYKEAYYQHGNHRKVNACVFVFYTNIAGQATKPVQFIVK